MMDFDSQCGSTELMGHLIKYFESQSRRLDRQTFQSPPGSFKLDYESVIKFNGVPILPPAITFSRRDELRQYRKDAVLLEKRLKARQRQQLLAKADSLVSGSPVCFPSTTRQAARQLNFDSDRHDGLVVSNQTHDKLEMTESCSTLAVADTGANLEEFGLHTMDSVNSDFMSLDPASVPKVFDGLLLTSAKEQKISYDLDRLSKALNVQELSSTSSSDLSEGPHLNCSDKRENFQSAKKFAEKFMSQETAGDHGVYSIDFSHISHSSSDRPSSASGEVPCIDHFSVTEFVDSTNSSNLEHTHNSHTSSPRCGSITTNADGLGSNRSSPKSLKSGVHFASFVTEYTNTSASQSLEYPTIVKKQMSFDHTISKQEHGTTTVVPVIGDPGESRRRILLSRKVSSGESTSGLLDNVSLCLDSDSSPLTPPFNGTTHTSVFQSFRTSETSSSDKENDVSQLCGTLLQDQKKPSEFGNKRKCNSGEIEGSNSHHSESVRQRTGGDDKSDTQEIRSILENKVKKDYASVQSSNQVQLTDLQIHRDVGNRDLSSACAASDGINHGSSFSESSPALMESVTSGVATIDKTSVSDSQSSSKSNTLTNTSESSSNTVREDPSKDTADAAMNIVDPRHGYVNLKTGQSQEEIKDVDKNKNSEGNHSFSPKKLNTDSPSKEPDTQDKLVTPKRNNICRNSYTLSEPSPALIQAQGRPEDRREKDLDQKTTAKSGNTVPSVRQNSSGQIMSSKRMQTVGAKDIVRNSVPSNIEKEGKAEHINKYLSQVQLQNSMSFSHQSWNTGHLSEMDEMGDMQEAYEEIYGMSGGIAENNECQMSVLDVLRSLAESQGSLEQLTVEELLELHQRQMNEKRQALIKHQQRDLEELFVQQRREVMLLESEIKAAQKQEREHQQFLMENAPENIKVKSRSKDEEYSPDHTRSFESARVRPQQRKPMAENTRNVPDKPHPQQVYASHSSETNLKLQPKSYSGIDEKSSRAEQVKPKSQFLSKKANFVYSTSDASVDENQSQMKTVAGDVYSRSLSNAVVMRIANRTPEFSPSVSSPHKHQPVVMRSPLKYTSTCRRADRVVVPSEAFLPEMQTKFDRVSAAAKGYLTRCLLRSDKVQELIKTIRDTREFAFSFQTETPIKKGMFTSQDRVLLERIVAQLQAALLDLHEIFFEIPVSEQMALIEQTRVSEQEKRTKFVSRDSVRESGPKLSQATLKALERKRKSREAEVLGTVNMSRPKTAPPSSSSPRSNHTDISGPLRRHFGQLISKAFKPLQGHAQASPVRPETSRSEKVCPDMTKEKQLTRPKRIIAASAKSSSTMADNVKDLHKDGSIKLTNTSSRTSVKSNKQSSRPSKSWR